MTIMTISYFMGIIVGLFALWWASDQVVDNSLTLAQQLGVSSFIIGAILVAVLGGMPELIVGLAAIFRNVPEVAIGDILGANMCNVSFVLLAPLFIVNKLTLGKEGRAGLLFMLSITVLAMLTMLSYGFVPRWSGIFLICIYGAVLAALWYRREIDVEEYKEELQDDDGLAHKCAYLGLYMALAAGSGIITVYCAEQFSNLLQISVGSVGTLLFALGTSIPEMAIGINAAKRGATGFVLGSVVGAVLSHTLLVLGILAMMSHGGLDLSAFSHTIPFIAIMYGFLGHRIYTKASISKLDAFVLSSVYLLFYLVELGILNF